MNERSTPKHGPVANNMGCLFVSLRLIYPAVMEIQKTHKASCHCKAVQFEVHLPNGLENLLRCNCTFCRMRGAVMMPVNSDQIRILQGAEKLTLYQFHTKTAKHYFCSICGIYTHHNRRSDPNHFAFNVACLDGVIPYELNEVRLSDGMNHPADRK